MTARAGEKTANLPHPSQRATHRLVLPIILSISGKSFRFGRRINWPEKLAGLAFFFFSLTPLVSMALNGLNCKSSGFRFSLAKCAYDYYCVFLQALLMAIEYRSLVTSILYWSIMLLHERLSDTIHILLGPRIHRDRYLPRQIILDSGAAAPIQTRSPHSYQGLLNNKIHKSGLWVGLSCIPIVPKYLVWRLFGIYIFHRAPLTL